MAAMTAVLLAAKAETGGRHVVAVRPLYGGTDHLLGSGVLDIDVTYCTAAQVGSVVRPDTCLVVIETPANPTLDLIDLAAVVPAAAGRPVLVDNTFATPILQNPAQFGADMVLHSATKYLGGHGDVVAGVVATNATWASALRRVRAVTGGILHPLAGYLLHRGLATLPVRVRAAQASANKLAAWLTAHPSVEHVYYPGLPECDPHGLVPRQMRGPGAMISIRLAGGYQHAARLVSTVRLFEHAVSLGGVVSLIQHPASLTHRPVPPHARPGAGVVRLSIGLEDVEDLRADLLQALHAIGVPDAAGSR
jgi:methionine-gamma-lyase